MFIDRKRLSRSFIDYNSNIKDCIRSLNASSLQICNVLNSNRSFIGTITDGDVRRGLLNGLELTSSIKTILNKSPIISNKKISNSMAEKIVKKFDVSHLPIVKGKKLIDLFCINYTKLKSNKIKNKIVIMAGGYGKRLGKLTKNTPKGMLKLNGKPLLQHIIEGLKKEGFKNIIISTYFLKNKIKKYFSNGKKFGVHITYLEEKKPMGTIGSLGLINKIEDPFFVINCDVITDLNFKEMLRFHIKNKNCATMATKSFEFTNPYGVVVTKNYKFKQFKEKPVTYFNINAGIYLFNPKIINIIKLNQFKSVVELLLHLKKKKKEIKIFSMFENWVDYGLDKKNLKV